MQAAAINPEDTVERLFLEHDTRSRLVYMATLAMTVGGLMWAARTEVDIAIRAPVMLASASERQTVRTSAEGVVVRAFRSALDRVSAGDTILMLDNGVITRSRETTIADLNAHAARRNDLRTLMRIDFAHSLSAAGKLHEQGAADAQSAAVEWKQASTSVTQMQHAHDRASQLAERGFAVKAEVESTELDLARATEERALAVERRRAAWAMELARLDQESATLQRDSVTQATLTAARAIVAPLSGTLEELMPLTAGSVVRSGDAIATISPSGTLIADALLQPRDVAHLRTGMRARIRIDGYDPQQWGNLSATVASIAHDYTLSNSRPVFRVRLALASDQLARPGGGRVTLGKGLQGQVRFIASRQRLSTLLRHRMSEWLDPRGPSN